MQIRTALAFAVACLGVSPAASAQVKQVDLTIPQNVDTSTLDVAVCGNDVCSATVNVTIQQ